MKTADQPPPPTVQVGRYTLALMATWTIIVSGILIWTWLEERREIFASARIQTIQAYNKDLVYRHWTAEQGGIYVPITEQMQPNPYLSYIENRDVTTTSGMKLTLVNPAWMTRQVHELGVKQYGHRGHITSLNPIRAENAADPWETEALRAFEHGETTVTSIESFEGDEYLRLMRPLITEQCCLKCHASQGYQVGDLRGGLSVSIPMAPLRTAARGHRAAVTSGLGLVWLLGLGGLGLGARHLRGRLRKHKLSEDALHRSENFLQTVIDAIPDTMIVVNLDYSIALTNRATKQLYGEDDHKLIGMKCHRIFHKQNQPCEGPEETCPLERVLATKSPVVVEHIHHHSDGDGYFVEVTVSPILDEAGEVVQIIEVCRDITDRKLTEMALRDAHDKLETRVKGRTSELATANEHLKKEIIERTRAEEQAQKYQSDLAHATRLSTAGEMGSAIAHELTQPLTVVLNGAEVCARLLREKDENTAELIDVLDTVAAQAERAGQIVNRLKYFVQKQEIQRSSVNLNKLVCDAMKFVHPEVTERGIEIRSELDETVGLLWADSVLITQVLVNLIRNAIDAMDETELVQRKLNIRTSQVKEQQVEISVCDAGKGISGHDLDGMFDPFYTTKPDGMGIGLSLSRSLIESHGGRLWATPNPDHGLTLRFTLPTTGGCDHG